MYKTIDEIPAKIYFKIVETGNLSLLSVDKVDDIELLAAWEIIEKENSHSTNGKEEVKALDIPKKIEVLWARHESIRLAILVLRKVDDEQMKELLSKNGFEIGEDINASLNKIEKQSEAFMIKIDALHVKLPKINKSSSAKTSFDKVVLSYCAITGLGFIDTNKITLSQYYALLETGNEKITALENSNKKTARASK